MTSLAAFVRSSLWWLVPLVALSALIAYETDFGRAVRTTPPAPETIEPRPVTIALLPEYTIAGGVAARRETVERTLFSPTRRPAPPLAVEAAKPRMQRGQFALTGTLMVDGKNMAFLRETNGGRSRRVAQGETINGLLVAEVKPDRIKLAMGDEAEELVLRVTTNPRTTPQPAVAAAPATPAPPVPTGPGAAGTAAASEVAQTLAERRRAARAAQAAAQAQTSTPDGNPIPAAPAAAMPQAAPAPTVTLPPPATPPAVPAPPAAAPARTSDAATANPTWNDVYQRYQYRTR